jgi:imidazolonepropionase-like amidohydrolase
MRWIALGLFSLAFAARPPAGRTVAIKDAMIVLAPLLEIEKGTVLLRDGLIAQVGAGLAVPPEAEVIDGKGLVVYPGFIDGRTTLGLPDTKRPAEALKLAEGEKPDFAKDALPAMEQANRKGLRPELDAAALLNLAEADLKKAHAGGFTLASVAAANEYLSGTAALVTLSGAPRRNALLRGSSVAHAAFRSYGDGYPTTTMGALSHLRQAFADAGHYARLWDAHKPGRPRPAVDAALEALKPVLAGQARLFFEAETRQEIDRALALAAEFRLRAGIAGGSEAWRVADVLRARDVPVLLSLKLPKEPKPKDAEFEPEKLRQERRRLWKEPLLGVQRLHQAKVRFGFSTAGLASPAEALESVATLVEHGLSHDAALAALTTLPAQIFGLQATHGTIARGKAANLTVLTGRLGQKKSRVRYVFADGAKFEYPAPPGDPSAPAAKPAASGAEAGPKAAKPAVLGDADVEIEADRVPKTRTGGNVLLKNATILTVADAGTVQGDLRVKDGKIVAVGRTGDAPEGATVIDATGLYVMPGIIDCHSHIAIEGGINESSQSVVPEVRIGDVINARDVAIYRALAGGVTAANILHGSANAIGGQNAVIRLKYGKPAAELLFPGAPRGVKFALGENPKQSNWGQNRGKRFPNTRMGVEAVYRRAFTEALEYEAELGKDPLRRRDQRLEALLAVLKGEIRVHCHCYRADEILMILQVAKEFGFRIATLQHVLEGYRVAPEIAAAGTGASTFSDWWSYKIEAYEAIPHNAALMTQAGVVTSINSDSPEQIRHLNVEAAKGMKYGRLSEREALALVTINPARQLGIDRRVGTIEAGKDADLAVYNGHPLSPYSRCVLTLIEGEVYFEDPARPVHATRAFLAEARPRRLPGEPPRGDLVAIAGADIHPMILPPFRGTIVLEKGKIVAMGPDVRPPDRAEVIEGAGLSVYPGLIDASTSMGLLEIGSVAGTRDEAEIGGVQPDLKALTAVNPHSELIPVTRANGITTVLTVPQGGLIAGQSAVLRLDGWVPGEMAVKEAFALHVYFPGGPRRGDDPRPGSSGGDEDKHLKELREIFGAAKRYDRRDRDLKLEALQPYLKGERPVVFHADRARDIREAVSLAGELGLKPIISGGREAWKIAGLLAEKKVPVIIGAVMELPFERHDPYDSAFANAARLSKAGVRFAISSSETFSGNTRNTPYHAAWAAAYGLDREEALRALTVYPAMILGIEDRVGSLTVGKDADVIVTTGDPLEVVTDVVYLFIRGRAVPLDTKHTRSYEKFRQRLQGSNGK